MAREGWIIPLCIPAFSPFFSSISVARLRAPVVCLSVLFCLVLIACKWS